MYTFFFVLEKILELKQKDECTTVIMKKSNQCNISNEDWVCKHLPILQYDTML